MTCFGDVESQPKRWGQKSQARGRKETSRWKCIIFTTVNHRKKLCQEVSQGRYKVSCYLGTHCATLKIEKKELDQLWGLITLKIVTGDFPGGAVVKNLPANAGDAGSIPGPGRSHMPRSN